MRTLASLALALGFCAPLCPAGEPALDPDLPYRARRSDAVTYDVDFSVVVTAPARTRKLKVWLPLPQSDAGQEVGPGELSTFPEKVTPRVATEPAFGNKFAYFEFDRPEGAQIIRHRFKAKVWELRWGVEPAKVLPVRDWPAGFGRYLKADGSVVIDASLQSALREIVPKSKGAGHDLPAVMGWLGERMHYDPAGFDPAAGSDQALAKKSGDCRAYHGLCAAFGRALGVPTRVTYGLHCFAKNSPSHCKMEAYLPPYGWVSFDVSETQKLAAAIEASPALDGPAKKGLVQTARERLLSGFRDNTWLLQTRGTDYDLAPPAARKVAVVRTAYAEADGVALPEPNPGDPKKKEFSWMTAHRYTPDREVSYPFASWKSLDARK
jgi:transglutaminase-like putative cysteine protease